MSLIHIRFTCTAAQYQQIRTDPELLIEYIPFPALQADVFDALQDKDGAPTIANLCISQFKEAEDLGSFRLHFMVNRQFCCSDTDACAMDYIDFSYRFEEGEFLAQGEFINLVLDN